MITYYEITAKVRIKDDQTGSHRQKKLLCFVPTDSEDEAIIRCTNYLEYYQEYEITKAVRKQCLHILPSSSESEMDEAHHGNCLFECVVSYIVLDEQKQREVYDEQTLFRSSPNFDYAYKGFLAFLDTKEVTEINGRRVHDYVIKMICQKEEWVYLEE